MILNLSTETIIWLFPAVFMLHEFEEIIMFQPWMTKNQHLLEKRFPERVIKMLHSHKALSTSSFTLAVAEEFFLIVLLSMLTLHFHWYNFWAGLLMAFFIHLLVHVGQYLLFRRYVPVILTTLPAGLYALLALYGLNASHPLQTNQVVLWSIVCVVLLVVNLFLALRMAAVFERWLKKYAATQP